MMVDTQLCLDNSQNHSLRQPTLMSIINFFSHLEKTSPFDKSRFSVYLSLKFYLIWREFRLSNVFSCTVIIFCL